MFPPVSTSFFHHLDHFLPKSAPKWPSVIPRLLPCRPCMYLHGSTPQHVFADEWVGHMSRRFRELPSVCCKYDCVYRQEDVMSTMHAGWCEYLPTVGLTLCDWQYLCSHSSMLVL